MSGPGRLALTGSIFTLPLVVLGLILTLVGWLLQRWADRDPLAA